MDQIELAVLLVEDSEPERELIKEYFLSSSVAQFSVLVAERLAEAIDLLARNNFDIIVLDLGLPDSHGLDTLKEILKSAEGIPVVVLTGNDDMELGYKAISLGAQDFLAKGEKTEALLPRICVYSRQRHVLQQKVLQAESFLRNTVDSLVINLIITDCRGNILLTNKSWDRFLEGSGIKASGEGVQTNIYSIFKQLCHDPDLFEEIHQKTEQVASGALSFAELEYPCSRDSESWFHLRISPFMEIAKGALAISHSDITQRKKIEETLKRNEEYLRIVFDTTPNVVFVKDDEGRYTMANKAQAVLYGCSVSDMIGKTDEEIMRGSGMVLDEAKNFFAFDLEVLKTKRKHLVVEEPLTDVEGKRHWFRTIKTPISFPGLPDHLLGIASEITQEREDKQRIKDSEVLLRTILDAMHYHVMLIDEDMSVIWANRKAIEDLPADSEVVGKPCCKIWPLENVCPDCPARRAFKSREKEIKLFQVDKDVAFRVIGCPVINEEGEVKYVLVLREDVSERVSLERQLRQAQKMEALGTLAGGIAHDFNNILTAILGYTELGMEKVRRGENLQRLPGDLEQVRQASLRATDLVHQILTFSRRIDQEFQPLDVSFIIKEALKLLRATLPSSIRLQSDVPINLGKIFADPTQIHQIVMNLCTNAAHAIGSEDGRLSVGLKKICLCKEDLSVYRDLTEGEYLEISVSDNGCGIPNDLLHTIFEPYFTTKELGEGTGLGLAVVHGIVKDCGGGIKVASRVGFGTTFSLLFPVIPEQEVVMERGDKLLQTPEGDGQVIFVVDDEPPIMKLCERILKIGGYTPVSFTDSFTALQEIKKEQVKIDLLLTDFTMPHMTGDKLALEVREILPDLPVLIMSGNIKELPETYPLKNKIKIIKKPFDKKYLLDIVAEELIENEPVD